MFLNAEADGDVDVFIIWDIKLEAVDSQQYKLLQRKEASIAIIFLLTSL